MTFKFSVVIPLYNKEKHIERAIRSVLNQALSVDEIIVVDDGSIDNGAKVVEKLACEKILLIRQLNQGVSVARNTGIKACRNELILLLDADDIWLPHFTTEITKLVTLFPDAGMFATAYAFLTEEKIIPATLKGCPNETGIIADYFLSCIKADLPITASSVAIKKSLIMEIGGFSSGMKMGEDQLLWSRIAYKHSIAYSVKISVYYDKSIENSACKVNLITHMAPHIQFWEQDLKLNRVPLHLHNSLIQLMHFSALYCVKNNLKLNNKKQARYLLFNEPNLKRDIYWFISIFLTFIPLFIIKRIL